MKSLRALFGAVIFLGAFLLFIVQPMIGKFILPFFGGKLHLRYPNHGKLFKMLLLKLMDQNLILL